MKTASEAKPPQSALQWRAAATTAAPAASGRPVVLPALFQLCKGLRACAVRPQLLAERKSTVSEAEARRNSLMQVVAEDRIATPRCKGRVRRD